MHLPDLRSLLDFTALLPGRRRQARGGVPSRAPRAAVAIPAGDVQAAADQAGQALALRLAISHSLWGEWFFHPGGLDEAQRLAKPLSLNDSTTLLLVGSGMLGAARAIAALGSYVTVYETEKPLVAPSLEEMARHAKASRKVEFGAWDQARLKPGAYRHAALIGVGRTDSATAALGRAAAALKPQAQLLMIEPIAGEGFDPTSPLARRWGALEGRVVPLANEEAVLGVMAGLGFDVRVREDMSQRHLSLALIGWQRRIAELARHRPGRAEAAVLVEEAERWLLRLKLLQMGQLRLMRWHAMR